MHKSLRWLFVTALASTFLLLPTALSPISAATVQPKCSIVYNQNFNHLSFNLQWSNGYAVFNFDDGSKFDLFYTSGWANLPHDYPFDTGGTRTFHPKLSINTSQGQVSCETTVTISSSASTNSEPVCSIQYDQNGNHLTYHLNSSDGPAVFSFGDNSQTGVANGPQSVSHDYAFAVNGTAKYTPVLTIDGSRGKKTCTPSSPITITHTQPSPPAQTQPTCSITYTQQFNSVNFSFDWTSGSAVFSFDDGSTYGLSGSGGSSSFSHAYAYLLGGTKTYTPRLTINTPQGNVSCTTTISIVD